MKEFIIIKGAKENNLKSISIKIPKYQLVVVTGPSGSGKSTLALDILQRECQRQYMESSGLATGSMSKPRVDTIIGLSPSIAITQHATNRNPRSTVGTVTDLYALLRLIFQQKGQRRCIACRAMIPPKEAAYDHEEIHCPACNARNRILTKTDFSFNAPNGACRTCGGLGTVMEIDIERVFDKKKNLSEGAITFMYESMNTYLFSILKAASKHYKFEFDLEKPLAQYTDVEWDLLLYGVESEEFSRHFPSISPPKTVTKGRFKGVLTGMWQKYREKDGQSSEAAYFQTQICSDCNGERLNEESRQVTVNGQTLPHLSQFSLFELQTWIEQLRDQERKTDDALFDTVLHDLLTKLNRLNRVGLGYLTMDRQVITLSGGETQRLRLATVLGSGLTGVLYLLDEPTSGLHPRDAAGLIQILKELRDLGNTVLIIEHSKQVIEAADHIIDMGPGAGSFGGEIIGQGSPSELMTQPKSITGHFLKTTSPLRSKNRSGNGKAITIHGATHHNLKNINVSFPLHSLITVSGVSGSGKSTLVFDILANANDKKVIGCQAVTGLEWIQKMITVGQAPLTRMKRSNVATYLDLFTLLRNLFASLPEAKKKGFRSKHFSFNTSGGRCERCEGMGIVDVDMFFLTDLKVTCPACKGKRYRPEILAIQYQGYSITDILSLGIEESLSLFQKQRKIVKLLNLLCEVGLGYLQWGQPVTTLSGGEGQRLKLAKELSSSSHEHTLYLLDEPTTGLHATDIEKLYVLLSKLVDAGNTVILVEHNMDLISASDWVIDMGHEGGEMGGQVIVSGIPEEVAKNTQSYTGQFLSKANLVNI